MFLLVTFHYCDIIPKKIKLKEKKIISAHSFRGFGPWSLGPIASSMQQGHGGAKLLISWHLGRRKTDRNVLGTRYTLQRQTPRNLLPPNGPHSSQCIQLRISHALIHR
jgi:hypothetical protein